MYNNKKVHHSSLILPPNIAIHNKSNSSSKGKNLGRKQMPLPMNQYEVEGRKQMTRPMI